MRKILNICPTIGADPEIFLRDSKGQLVDSISVLKKVQGFNQIKLPDGQTWMDRPRGSIAPDGVQAEIHPQYEQCLGYFANNVFGLILGWTEKLEENGYTVDFTQSLEVDNDDLERFSPECRELGCQPSSNLYDPDRGLGIDVKSYRWRSAGGHIHIGHNLMSQHPLVGRMQDIVPLLDVLVGNTSVLIDRDPLAAKRREVYGRAGEFRLPSYGLEYRTLSNFWLRASPLYSLMFELARNAFQIALTSIGLFDTAGTLKPNYNYAGELLSAVKLTDVIEAINSSNFDLAMSNFKKIRGFIEEHFVDEKEASRYNGSFPLTKKKIPDFLYFVEKGYPHFFGKDPLKWLRENFTHGSFAKGSIPTGTHPQHWNKWSTPSHESMYSYDPGHARGWNTFLLEILRPERLKSEETEQMNIFVPPLTETNHAMHV